MKEIGAVTIGKLIESHYEKDEHKFKAYAEFIAEAYKERGEERAERIIRSKIDGSYKNKPVVVTLDRNNNDRFFDCMHGYIYAIPEHNVYLHKCNVQEECNCVGCNNFIPKIVKKESE